MQKLIDYIIKAKMEELIYIEKARFGEDAEIDLRDIRDEACSDLIEAIQDKMYIED